MYIHIYSRQHVHTWQTAIENATTPDEHKPKTARNRSPDCHLSPDWRQMATEKTARAIPDTHPSASRSLPTAAHLVWYEPVISTWYETFSRSNRFSGSDASFIILTKSVKWRESRARTENLQNAVKPHHCTKCYCVCDHHFIQATH